MDIRKTLIVLVTVVPVVLSGACDRPRHEIPDGRGVREDVQGGRDMETKTETATFAAGCFWGVEETFRTVQGVVDAEVGYTGGEFANPTYEDVCSDRTGHAEAVRLQFDPEKVSYAELLEVFWKSHDPTTLNPQSADSTCSPPRPEHVEGAEVGSQYRSAIFTHSPQQKKTAEDVKRTFERSGRFAEPIATQIVPASVFWRAEEYHQQYLKKKGLGSCPAGE